MEAGASKALMVVALLRSHQSDTQRLSMQAVHNLMADEGVRMQVLDQGGVFVLLKLAQPKLDMPTTHIVHRDGPGGQD